MAAPNDLLLEVALPAELTDTWLAHAMWTHPQHCNGVSEYGSHRAVAFWDLFLVFQDRQFIWI